MKMISPLLYVLLIVSCAAGNEKTYTGSTPAHSVIRSFLGISPTDSIDFIRWRLIIQDNRYQLQCNYGIGKPNTNGFIKGGTQLALNGACTKDKNYYRFQNGTKILKAVELNSDLLHLLNSDNSLLIGNGGWSYALNNITPVGTDNISLHASTTALKDSMVFEGRTPCNVPEIIEPGSTCYKLKWYVILYANSKLNQPGSYKVFGTPWRQEGGRTGNWKVITGKNGRTIYQLYDDKGNKFLHLLKLDENILAFTDAVGKVLVGNEDFSYTLNRRL